MSLSQTNIQLEQINEPCSGRSVHSYTSPNYICLRCHRTSSPNYPLGVLIGLLYTNLQASTILQKVGAVLWTTFIFAATLFRGAGAVFSHTPTVLSLQRVLWRLVYGGWQSQQSCDYSGGVSSLLWTDTVAGAVVGALFVYVLHKIHNIFRKSSSCLFLYRN